MARLASFFIFSALVFAFFAAGSARASEVEVGDGAIRDQAERAHRELWSRFVSPAGVVLDYVGLNGEIVLPTPEECEAHIPNALGWWTPIENGGFFTGMYLTAQCDRYDDDKSPENREKVKRLVAGLYALQDAGQTPGFIARGMGSDGRCHYAASSNDQNFPWFLGLGRYLETDIPDDAERRECVERLVRHGEALRGIGWRITGDKPGFNRGWWLGNGYVAAVHIATATRVLHEATGDAGWLELHESLLRGESPDGRQRLAVISEGPDKVADWSAWYLVNCQYAVAALLKRAKDPRTREAYAASLRRTGRAAAALVARYRDFDPSAPPLAFTPDWHAMMPPFREQKNGDEAVKLAMEQLKVWKRANPAIAREKTAVCAALCAAWMVALSGDDALIAEHRPDMRAMVAHFDYTKLHYATFFYVEPLARALGRAAGTGGGKQP